MGQRCFTDFYSMKEMHTRCEFMPAWPINVNRPQATGAHDKATPPLLHEVISGTKTFHD
jgi:hypothetical protein